jgi:molybdenum cofactor guanylyltransferase
LEPGEERTLGVILAGGESRRFGADKAAARLGGRTLLEHAIARARPQVDDLAISASNPAAAGPIAIPDGAPGQGPLSGVLASLRRAQARGFDMMATFPCDAPFFPANLVERLRTGLGDDIDCAIAKRGPDHHYVFALWRTSCAESLADAFGDGLRSLRGISTVLRVEFVTFPVRGDGPDGNAFFNINLPENLTVAEAWISSRAT